MKRLKHILPLGLLLLAPLLMVHRAYAASGSIFLSPNTATVINGNNVSVVIHENSGATQVNGVQANLSFPASLLSVNSVTGGPSWGIVAQNQYDNSAGTINFAAGNIGPLTGDQVVATISFKAKASAGTASVSFTGGTAVTEANGSGTPLSPLSTSGGTYYMAAPAGPPPPPPPPPAPTPTPTPPPSPGTKPSPSPTPTPTPPASTPGLKVSGVTATDIGLDTATIVWTSSAAANSQIDYGLNSGTYSLTASNGDMVTNHKLVLHSALIQPGTTYHYRVKSIDPAGHSALSPDLSFTTKGMTVQVTVLNQGGKPVSGATVALNYATTSETSKNASIAGETDDKGQVSLSGLPGREVLVISATITHGGKKTNFDNVKLKSFDPKNPTQSLTFKIKATKSTSPVIILIPLLLLGVLVGLLMNRGKKTKDWHFPDTTTPSAGAGGGTAASGGMELPAKQEPTIVKPNPPTDTK